MRRALDQGLSAAEAARAALGQSFAAFGLEGLPRRVILLAFGLLLRSHGWRILFLGADTPISTPDSDRYNTPDRP